jgi:hypothetical protein
MAEFRESPDAFIGLYDAMTTIIGVLLALGIQPSVFAEPFESQRDAHRVAGRGDAAGLLDALRDFVIDPELQRQRQMIQLIHKAPPAGRA